MPPAIEEQNRLYKQQAAERAVDFVQSGMVVGLGTGSTAIFAVHRIAQLLSDGRLRDVVGCATSRTVAEEARKLGITLIPDEVPNNIDLTIDGADEVDPQWNLIKGGGGALLREKIVAQASAREIIVVDEGKLSPKLGINHLLPVEVLVFGWRSQVRYLESLGTQAKPRTNEDGSTYFTDQGNMIFDCNFGPIEDPADLAGRLSVRAGIVEHGLFVGLATDLIIAGRNGVRHLAAK